jgi:hypothetical protein
VKSVTDGKTLTIEIAELLKNASHEQKLLIKGILLGVKIPEGKNNDRKAG